MGENLEELADAVENWKQTKYHLERLIESVFNTDVDPQAFKDEFVEDEHPIDPKLFKLLQELAQQKE